MLISEPDMTCPFPIEGLHWCQVEFDHADARQLIHHNEDSVPFQIDLPDHLNRAVPKRRSEFLAGRLCAAMALRKLNLPEYVSVRKDRSPKWPIGATGSITHTDHIAIAVISNVYGAIGLDCEHIMDHARAIQLRSMILDEKETALRPSTLDLKTFVTLIFSAKEALYKAISGQVGRILEFHEVTLIAVDKKTLSLSFEGTIYDVHWLVDGPICLTLVTIPKGSN